MKYYLIILFLFIILFTGCSNNVIHYAGWTSFGNLAQTEIDSLNQVPQLIIEKTNIYLQQKADESITNQFTFVRGEKIDVHRVENLIDFKWQVYSYRLIFMFSYPTSGLTSYEFDIQLDSLGNLLKDIELPEGKNNSHKFEILNLEKAKDVADENNFIYEEIDFNYMKEINSFVWVFQKQTQSRTYWLYINANNGAVVDTISCEHIH